MGRMEGNEAQRSAEPGRAAGVVDRLLPSVLAVRDYRRLWYYSLIFFHANTYEHVVAGWSVLILTGSPFAVGLVGFCRALPMLVLGLVLSTVAERLPGSTVLLGVQVTSFLGAAALAALFTFGDARLWQICLLTGLLGCAFACDFSVRRNLIARLIAPDRFANAMSLETMTRLGCKIGATALGGLLLALDGPRLAYWWLAAVYLAGIALTVGLRHQSAAAQVAHPTPTISTIGLIRLGWSAAVRTPVVQAVLLVTVVMNLLVFPYQHLIAVIARDVIGVGSARMGILAGIDGVGALLVAGLLTFRARPGRLGLIFLIGALSQCALIAVLTSLHSFALALVVQVAVGACSACFGSMQPAIIMGNMPPELRARALGLLAMAIGVGPFGMLLAGALSTAIGPSRTLSGMSLLALVLILGFLVRNRTLLRQQPVLGMETLPDATNEATPPRARTRG